MNFNKNGKGSTTTVKVQQQNSLLCSTVDEDMQGCQKSLDKVATVFTGGPVTLLEAGNVLLSTCPFLNTLPRAASAGCSCKMASPVSTLPQSIQMNYLHLETLPGLPNRVQNMPRSRKITFLVMTFSLQLKARCWTRKAFGPLFFNYFILEVQNYHS